MNLEEKIFVIITVNGKRLEYDNKDWVQNIVGDAHGAPQYIKVTNRRNETLQNFINWDHVSHMWINVTKKERKYEKDFKTSTEANDVQAPEISTNPISSSVLNNIRQELISDSEAFKKGEEVS